MRQITCIICQKPLTGGLDTYGQCQYIQIDDFDAAYYRQFNRKWAEIEPDQKTKAGGDQPTGQNRSQPTTHQKGK